jgi:hypothetical protein
MQSWQVKSYDSDIHLQDLQVTADAIGPSKTENIYTSFGLIPALPSSASNEFVIDQNLAIYIRNYTWAGLNYRLRSTTIARNRLRPYLSFYSPNRSLVLTTGVQLSPTKVGPFVSFDKRSTQSHLSLKTVVSKSGHLNLFWMNYRFGGPLIKYTDRLYLGYLHSLEITSGTFLSLKSSVNWEEGFSGISAKASICKTTGPLKDRMVQ